MHGDFLVWVNFLPLAAVVLNLAVSFGLPLIRINLTKRSFYRCLMVGDVFLFGFEGICFVALASFDGLEIFFAINAVVLMISYVFLFQSLSFKILKPNETYDFEVSGYGDCCLSGSLYVDGLEFRALLEDYENPSEDDLGRSFRVKIIQLQANSFFPVRVELKNKAP